jgi:hypothetical protein
MPENTSLVQNSKNAETDENVETVSSNPTGTSNEPSLPGSRDVALVQSMHKHDYGDAAFNHAALSGWLIDDGSPNVNPNGEDSDPSKSGEQSPEDVKEQAEKLKPGTLPYRTNDNKIVDLNKIAVREANEIETELRTNHPLDLGINPIQILSEGSKGTTLTIKDTYGKLNKILTEEYLKEHHFKRTKYDEKNGIITLEYDLESLTDPKQTKIVELRGRPGLMSIFGVSESDTVKVFDSVKDNYEQVSNNLVLKGGLAPITVNPEKLGLKSNPTVVIIQDKNGDYLEKLKANYGKIGHDSGFETEKIIHNGVQYAKLVFAPTGIQKLDQEDKENIIKNSDPKVKPETKVLGSDATGADLAPAFKTQIERFFHDRLGLKSFLPVEVWSVGKIEGKGPNESIAKDVSPGDAQKLLQDPEKAANSGIVVEKAGDDLIFKFDPEMLKASKEERTINSHQFLRSLYMVGNPLFSNGSEEVTASAAALTRFEAMIGEIDSEYNRGWTLTKGVNLLFASSPIPDILHGMPGRKLMNWIPPKVIKAEGEDPNIIAIEDPDGEYAKCFRENKGFADKNDFTVKTKNYGDKKVLEFHYKP